MASIWSVVYPVSAAIYAKESPSLIKYSLTKYRLSGRVIAERSIFVLLFTSEYGYSWLEPLVIL